MLGRFLAMVLVGMLGWGATLAADDARVAEMERQLRGLRQQVEAMKASSQGSDVAEVERKIDVLTREIENLKLGEAAPEASVEEGGVHGLGPAASKVYAVKQGLEFFNIGFAAAIANIAILCIAVFSVAFVFLVRRADRRANAR